MNGYQTSPYHHGQEEEELHTLNGYQGVHNPPVSPSNFDFEFQDVPSPRPVVPYRPGHAMSPRYSPPDYAATPGWLQPTPRTSDVPEAWMNSPYDSRSASPTLVCTPLHSCFPADKTENGKRKQTKKEKKPILTPDRAQTVPKYPSTAKLAESGGTPRQHTRFSRICQGMGASRKGVHRPHQRS